MSASIPACIWCSLTWLSQNNPDWERSEAFKLTQIITQPQHVMIWCPHVKRPGHPSFKEKQMCNTFKEHLQIKLFLANNIFFLILKSQEIPCHNFPLNSCLQCVCFNAQLYLWTEMQLMINTNTALFDPKWVILCGAMCLSNTEHKYLNRTCETSVVMNECYRKTSFPSGRRFKKKSGKVAQ